MDWPFFLGWFSACSMSFWKRLQHPHSPIGNKLQTLANRTLAFHTKKRIGWIAFSLNQSDILNFTTLLIYDYQSNSLHIYDTEPFIPILYTDIYLPGRLIDFYLAIFKLTSADNHANFEWLTEIFLLFLFLNSSFHNTALQSKKAVTAFLVKH